MSKINFYRFIKIVGIGILLILLLFFLTDRPLEISSWFRAQLTQMGITMYPAPSITTDGEVFSPSHTEVHRFEASSEDSLVFTNSDESFIEIFFSPGTADADIDFLAHSYAEEFIISDRPLPQGVDVVGGMFYDFTAFEGSAEKTTFDTDFTLKFNYTDTQITEFEEGTLKVYFWDESQNIWVLLPNFTLDPVNNTITVLTDHLTLFAIFGEPKRAVSGGGSGFNVLSPAEEVPEEVISKEEIVSQEELVLEKETPPEEVSPAEEREKEISSEKITESPIIPETSKITFDVGLTIKTEHKQIYPDNDLLIQGEIIKFGPSERIDIPLHYQIKDENGVVVLDYTEIMVIEAKLSFVKAFYVAKEAILGTYTIYLEVSYDDTSVSSSDTFEIIKRTSFIVPGEVSVTAEKGAKRVSLVLSIFLIILIVFVLGLWKMRAIIRKVKGKIRL